MENLLLMEVEIMTTYLESNLATTYFKYTSFNPKIPPWRL